MVRRRSMAGAVPPAHGAYGESETFMDTCDSRFVQPPDGEPRVVCPGGHHKFDTCRDEALYEWTLDCREDSTGNTDFEGHLTVMIVHVDEVWGLGQTDGPDEREVIIPAGNYLVWTASTGAVSVREVDAEQQAWEIYDQVDARYGAWEIGCDPNDLAGHADCEDTCSHPEWMDAVR
jgi:hypothetical protein